MTTSQFDSALKHHEAAVFGIWVFLATEVLFFGPLFFGYVHGRVYQHEAFVAASHHMHLWLGTINTALLLTSSFTMALAVGNAQSNNTTKAKQALAITALLGVAFLGIKAFEYASEWSEAVSAAGGEARFYFLYFAMTGLHALHLLIGIALIFWLYIRSQRIGLKYQVRVEVTGIYWHFIDIVWIFLYPLFYLLERYR